MFMYKYVCCASSVHSLLLFFLINPDASSANTVFFFANNGGVRTEISQNLEKVCRVKVKHSLIQRVFNYYRIKYIFSKLNLKNALRFGFDEGGWTEYIVHTSNDFRLIEDGLNNYIKVKESLEIFHASILRRLLARTPFLHLPYGLSKHVSHIYLTGIAKVPVEISDKVNLVSIERLWKLCSVQRKQEILKLFGLSEDISCNEKSVLLITQPLSEDNIMPEQDKLNIYKEIVNHYGENRILIKPHPRERTNYQKLFPAAQVLNSYFPIELLTLTGEEFSIKTVVTIFSTSIYSFHDCEKVIIGRKAHPNLKFLDF